MAKSPFLESAEGCERFARTIKECQFSANGTDTFPIEDPGTAPPEEAWARRFACHVVSTIRSEGARPPLSLFLAAPADRPKMPVLPEEKRPVAPSWTSESGHIGSVLGKSGPPRTFVGRLFRGRGK